MNLFWRISLNLISYKIFQFTNCRSISIKLFFTSPDKTFPKLDTFSTKIRSKFASIIDLFTCLLVYSLCSHKSWRRFRMFALSQRNGLLIRYAETTKTSLLIKDRAKFMTSYVSYSEYCNLISPGRTVPKRLSTEYPGIWITYRVTSVSCQTRENKIYQI